MSGAPPLLVSREGGVVRATLNRPHRRNAIGGGMAEAFDALITELRADASARVLVLRGAGGHFCAGLDLAEVAATPAEQAGRNRALGARWLAISELPQVVVAAVEGACQAGGLGFACCADITLASADARFAAPEVLRGLVPAQILPWLARRMGRPQAARMVLEAVPVDAATAERLGLVHEVAADAATLDALLERTIARVMQGGPVALAETKGLLAALGPLSPSKYGDAAAAAFGRTAGGAEAAEGIAAFREKRKANWAV